MQNFQTSIGQTIQNWQHQINHTNIQNLKMFESISNIILK